MSTPEQITHTEEVAAAALQVVNALMEDSAALRRVALERLRWLTFEDVQYITGFEERKLSDLVKARTIPMFKAPGSSQWRMTVEAWTLTEAKLIKDGLLPRNVYKHRRAA